MNSFDISTHRKFLDIHSQFVENNNHLMRLFLEHQNSLSKDEIRISTTIIFQLSTILEKLYDFYRIIEIKKTCRDEDIILKLSEMNMKIRNENEFVFDKLRNGAKSISEKKLSTQILISIDKINTLFSSVVPLNYDASKYF